MLFFFGLGTSIIGSYPLRGVACGYCGTLGAVLLTIYSRYLHVFWLPVIPLGKASVSKCAHCQQVLEERQMPPAYRQAADALKRQAKLPFTNYAVLALLGVVVAFSFLMSLFK
ncbi:MAG: hypothetical protein ACRYF0_06385 [Janthinobacterium lividum]